MIKAFVIGNENDAVDARVLLGCATAEVEAVAIKTAVQQAVVAIDRIRHQPVKMRTAYR